MIAVFLMATAISLSISGIIAFWECISIEFSESRMNWRMLIDLLYKMGYSPKQISEILEILLGFASVD